MEAYKTEWYGSKAKVLRCFRDMQVIDYGCPGKGIITDIRLFPGIQLSLQDMETEAVFPAQTSDGYETVLGENGGTLSGGERQRISIARAILKDAPVIILDEATASLDPENEVFVQQAIANLSENKTVIMIAHRLRTITGADRIFVLEQGRVKESGTHAELLEQKGLYNKLFRLQNSMVV